MSTSVTVPVELGIGWTTDLAARTRNGANWSQEDPSASA